MQINKACGLLVGAALGTVSAFAIPVFDSGTAMFIFDPGNGLTTSSTSDPIPAGGPVFQLNASSPGPLSASGAAGLWHVEEPTFFGLNAPVGSGVSQSDTSGNSNGAATVTISFSANWHMNGQFGPLVFGFANAPAISGVVSAGIGSYVQMDITATFTGGATRSPIGLSYQNSTPGAFSTSLFNSELMTPNFIGNGLSENITGTVTFTARGVGDVSSISLGQDFGMTTPPNVPEPGEWAAVAGAGLLAFGFWRRCRREK